MWYHVVSQVPNFRHHFQDIKFNCVCMAYYSTPRSSKTHTHTHARTHTHTHTHIYIYIYIYIYQISLSQTTTQWSLLSRHKLTRLEYICTMCDWSVELNWMTIFSKQYSVKYTDLRDVIWVMWYITYHCWRKSKAIPITSRGGLYGCDIIRSPDCPDNRHRDGSEVVRLKHRPSSTPQKQLSLFWYTFFRDWRNPRA
jgi:hypothetical protein